MGGGSNDDRVTEYNLGTNIWKDMPSLHQQRWRHSICTLDNKIFVLGGSAYDRTYEMLDLRDDDPQWRYVAKMNSGHYGGGAVVVEGKIYSAGDTSVEVYDDDQGKFTNKQAEKKLQSREMND